MPTPQDVQAAIALLATDSALLHTIVHGSNTTDVALESGTVPSVAKLLAYLAGQITTGFASGYVVIVADPAARALATPAARGQLLIQLSDKAIYYADTLLQGGWIYHPIQNLSTDAAAAVAAVATLTTSLAGKMDISGYVGGAAAGVVRTANRLKEAADFLTTNSTSAQYVYGVENGGTGLFPALTGYRVVGLVDGVAGHTVLTNTSRRCQGLGSNFVFVNAPRRLVAWGGQGKFGTLGAGVNGGQGYFPRATIAKQQPDRALTGFDPNSLYSLAGQAIQVISQGAATAVLTDDGLVLVAGGITQGVAPLFGSGVDKTQTVLMPIYFNNSGTNATIRLMDIQDSTLAGYLASSGIFVDDSENVWLLGTNKTSAPYNVGVTGQMLTPVKLTSGFPSWSGKLIQKIRCDVTGGIYILFTNGELWAGGGSNATGLMSTGNTSNILNPVLLLTGVTDFDISGQTDGTKLALWVLQGTDFKAAGYNANGQMGQPTGPLANKTTFVPVDTDVNMIRLGGTDTVTVFYRKSTGTWYGLGKNTDGTFGQTAVAATNNVPVVLAGLTLIIQNNGGLVNVVLSGYAGKHAACVVTTNGKAFCAGNNTDGALANGTTTVTPTWTEVLWSPRDATEKIVDCSACTSPTGGPAFIWLTNHGRALAAGSATFGFATGVAPANPYTQLVAQPISLGTL